MKNLRNYIN